MAFKDTNNTFSDIAITSRLEKVNSFLKELDSIINFEKLRPILNKNGRGGKNVTGSPAYDNVLMFRILLVQKYYNLSDQSMEDALYVNLLFIRFVGLSLEDTVPDESTICRFRNSLLANKLFDKLFNAVNKQLEENNFIAKEGKSVLVDASLIKSENTQINNKTKEQKSVDKLEVETANDKLDIQINEELKAKTPSKQKIQKLLNAKEYNSKTMKNAQLDALQEIDTKDVKTSADIIENEKDSYDHKNKIDTDIRIGYQSSKKQYTQGYKVHIASDEESGVILKTSTTFANTADIDVLKPFIEFIPNAKAYYADKAYKSKEIDELLKSKDIDNMICLKEKQKMSEEDRKAQRESEKPKHKIRAKVEHRFADLKVQMKGGTTRFTGLFRNNMNFTISCLAANLRLIAYQQMNLKKSVHR
jgi:IS5 family transposase